MSSQNYTLEIISHHPEFKNRSLKKYHVDGIETIGAWGNEPFEIRFRNNTYQKIQVKISVDGTDILTGDPANTDVTKDMWVVNAYSTLDLKAWPESHNGGAGFVFTNANNSVAIHTHGDLSSRGIIAAAVFVESHVEPVRLTTPVIHHHNHHHYDWWNTYYKSYQSSPDFVIPLITCNTFNNDTKIGSSGSNSIFMNNVSNNAVMDCMLSDDDGLTNESSKSLQSLAAVGAGQYVNQKISYVQGLTKPLFTETVRVRYLWWDELVSKLKETNVASPHASGFPGDKNKGINLGSTPRINSPNTSFTKVAQPAYSRF